jgi:hypothetical protein
MKYLPFVIITVIGLILFAFGSQHYKLMDARHTAQYWNTQYRQRLHTAENFHCPNDSFFLMTYFPGEGIDLPYDSLMTKSAYK